LEPAAELSPDTDDLDGLDLGQLLTKIVGPVKPFVVGKSNISIEPAYEFLLQSGGRDHTILSVGSGYGETEKHLVNVYGEHIITIDPLVEHYNPPADHSRRLMPLYRTVHDFLSSSQPRARENISLILDWPSPNDATYGVEAVAFLKPALVLIRYASCGAAGSADLQSFLASCDCPADGHTKPDIYGIHGAYKKIFVAENHVAAGNFATVVLASLPNREMGKGKIVTEVKPATEKSLDDALAFLNKIRRTPMLNRLLTDTQVANILHEHWKTYKDIQLDVKMDYPGTQALVRKTLSKRKRSRKLWRDNTLVFAPMNVRLKEGHHWVILAWLMSGGEKTICYFDPLGNPAPGFLKGIFGSRDEPSDILEFKRVQFDGFQCGV